MSDVTVLSTREKINAIEEQIKNHPAVITELPTRHYFADGVYAREMFIPADTILTGKIHKRAQINVLSKGKIRVLVGEHIQELDAPFTVVSPPGTKRIAYAVTDCVWTTFLPTHETNIEKIEQDFTAASEDEYQEFLMKEQTKCLS